MCAVRSAVLFGALLGGSQRKSVLEMDCVAIKPKKKRMDLYNNIAFTTDGQKPNDAAQSYLVVLH